MKKFLSLLLSFVMLFTTFSVAFSVSAASDIDFTPSAETVALREEFGQYIIGEFNVKSDSYIGIPMVITTLVNPNVESCRSAAVYMVGTKVERIGTKSDSEIVGSLLARGYRVVIFDYLNNDKAQGTPLAYSIAATMGDKVWGGDAEYLVRGSKKINEVIGERSCFFLPAGYNVAKGIEYYDLAKHSPNGTKEYLTLVWNKYYANSFSYSDGTKCEWADSYADLTKKDKVTPIDTVLDLHIVYPDTPREEITVPVLAYASSNTQDTAMNGRDRPFIPKAIIEGYAFVYYEHEYIPMSRDDHYGHFDTCFTLSAYTANAVHSAAVRCIRYYAEDFGYDSDYVMGWGFSKSGFGPAILSDPDHETKGEFKTYDEVYKSDFPESQFSDYWNFVNESLTNDPDYFKKSPEEQPFKTDRHGNPLNSNITCVYSGAGWGCCYHMDWAFTENSVPFAASIGENDTTGGFNTFITSARNNFDKALNNESLFLVPKNMGHEPVYKWDSEYEVDLFDPNWIFLDNHIRNAISPTAPEVIWTLPETAKIHDSADSVFEIKFSRKMDIESVKKGVKLTRLTDGKVLELDWTVLHGATTFRYDSKGIINGSKYLLEIGTDCVAADNGVAIDKPWREVLTIGGDEVLNPVADASISQKNPDTNYGTTATLGASNNVAESDIVKSYLSFNREGGFDNVNRAYLVLSQEKQNVNTQIGVYGITGSVNESTVTWNNAPQNNTVGSGFIGAEKLDETIVSYSPTILDVTDYVKENSNSENLTFALEGTGKMGKVTHYDFEGYTNADFTKYSSSTGKGQYYWGGEKDPYNECNIVAGGNNGSGNCAYITGFVEGGGERMKIVNAFGPDMTTLTAEDIGTKFRASFYIKPIKDTTITVSMYDTTGYQNGGTEAKNFDAKAGVWNEIIYNVTVTEKMVQYNHTAVTITSGCNFYLDDVTIEYDSLPGVISSKEAAAASGKLQNPILVLYTPETVVKESALSAMVASGSEKYNTQTGSYVNGDPIESTDGTAKGYIKMPITDYTVGESATLKFQTNFTGNPTLSVYGILDDNTSFADNFDGNITWNTAFANELAGNDIETGKVFGGKPISTFTVTGVDCSIDVTDYVSYMKQKGYGNATFIFVKESATTVTTVDFEGIAEYTAYKGYAMNGFEVGIKADPKNSDNNAFYFQKSGTESGSVNGYQQNVTFTGLLKGNDTWEKSDIGTKYVVTFKQYSVGTEGQACGIFSNIGLPTGTTGGNQVGSDFGFNKSVTKNGSTPSTRYHNEWYDVKITFTVTENLVNKRADYTGIMISTGWPSFGCYVDDIVVTKYAPELSIELGDNGALPQNDKFVNFENISEYTAVTASSALKGFNYGLTTDPLNANNTVYYMEKSGKEGGTDSGYAQNLSFTGLIKENDKWSAADVGSKYTVTFDMLMTGPADVVAGPFCAISRPATTNYGVHYNDYNGALTTKYYIDGEVVDRCVFYDKWFTIEFTLTVTEDMVANYSDYTAIILASGWPATETYIDNIRVHKESSTTSTDKYSPHLTFGSDTTPAYFNAVALISADSKDSVVTFDKSLTLNHAPVSDAEGLAKMYFTFNKANIQHILSSGLNIKVNNPAAGNKLLVYALNEAVTEKPIWASAYANTLSDNNMATAFVFGGAPVAEITLTEIGEYTADVTEFLKANELSENVTFVVTAASGEGKTEIVKADLDLYCYYNETTVRGIEFSGIKPNQVLDKNNVMLKALLTYPIEDSVKTVYFIVDGEYNEGAVIKKGDYFYFDAKDLASGEHKVSVKAVFNSGNVADISAISFSVEGTGIALGDVNGDGTVDTVDLSDLKLKLAGALSDSAKFIESAADFNGDTIIDTVDLSALKLKLAGA